jgi:hypothetical protein
LPSPQQRLDLDRVLNSIDARAAVVILVDEAGGLETAAKGIDNPQAMFEICWSVAAQLAAELYDEMPAEQQKKAAIFLPTQEEARKLGVFRPQPRGR